MKIHIVMHESFEAPAAILTWIHTNSHTVSYTRIYDNEAFPEQIDFDFLIVMGGPQSPTTKSEQYPYFDGEKEKIFIRKAIEANIHVLGICLGAQFIGEALGALCERSPNREVGVFPITLTQDGKNDCVFSQLPSTMLVGHWHGDMPGLTPKSKVLATSEGCPRQIIAYTPNVYGFQCHFEFTKEAIEAMILHSTDELERYKGLPYIETVEQLRKHDYSDMNRFLFTFLDNFTASITDK